MSKYTTSDFECTRFATHPDGHVAMRLESGPHGCWQRSQGGMCRDEDMPGFGYVPVNPEQAPGRTMTDGDVNTTSDRTGVSPWAVRAVASDLGHTVIPEPTNAEKLAAALRSINHLHGSDIIDSGRIAELLDAVGVKAPEGGDE